MKSKKRQFLRKCESGIDTGFQAIWYIHLMVILLAFVWEFGRLAYIHSICLNAARVAAQDAAKDIDKSKFLSDQVIELKNEAQGNAESKFRELTDISVPVNVELVNAADTGRSRFVHVTTDVPVKLIMLGNLFNDQVPVIVHIEAYAEPAYGIDEEIQ